MHQAGAEACRLGQREGKFLRQGDACGPRQDGAKQQAAQADLARLIGKEQRQRSLGPRRLGGKQGSKRTLPASEVPAVDKRLQPAAIWLGKRPAKLLPADEVQAAKNQVKGQMVLDLEDPGMRLMRLGTRALFGEPIIGLSQGLARVDGVTTDEVCTLAEEVLTSPAVEVVVGPSEEDA